jgi:hypothetical protein
MWNDTNVICSECGAKKFAKYVTMTEAADVTDFDDENNAIVHDDAKWEVTDVQHSEIRCENGHIYFEGVA